MAKTLFGDEAVAVEEPKQGAGWDAVIGHISTPEYQAGLRKAHPEMDTEDIARQVRTFETFARAQKTIQLNIDAVEQKRVSENEKATYKEYNADELTHDILDAKLDVDDIGINAHSIYKGLLEDKALQKTDDVLAEKWLNDTLTEDDIKTAQKEGRLLNSNVVGAWLARLETVKFNVGVYDQALVRIREVRLNKAKYDETRLWLLENAKELGFQWDDTRNRLETAMSFTPKAESTPHISRAHRLVDNYAKANPEINDGTLSSVRRVQAIHDAIDAREDWTPAQVRDLTQALLLPYEEEKAKGWISGFFGAVTKFGPIPMILRASKDIRIKKQKILNSVLLIQPVSLDEFKDKYNSLESLFGVDSKESDLYYDKYVDLFSEPLE